MPRILTTVHDPVALAALCKLLGLPPGERALWLGIEEVFGWVVRVNGLRHPVACDTLTGLIAYHWHDNAFDRYAHLMATDYATEKALCGAPHKRFVEQYYALRPQLRRGVLCPVGRGRPREARRKIA